MTSSPDNTSRGAMRMIGLAVFVCCCIALPAASRAADADTLAKIKSAYILNFIKYVAWPSDAFPDERSPIAVAVLGEDTMGVILDQTLRTAEGLERPIVVRRYSHPRRTDFKSESEYQRAVEQLAMQMQSVHVLVLAASEKERASHFLQSVQNSRLLIIGETRELTSSGAMLALGHVNGKVVFYADMKTIEASSLRISSKLLRLAREN